MFKLVSNGMIAVIVRLRQVISNLKNTFAKTDLDCVSDLLVMLLIWSNYRVKLKALKSDEDFETELVLTPLRACLLWNAAGIDLSLLSAKTCSKQQTAMIN